MLEKELEYFGQHKEELLKQYQGRFLVIKNDRLVGDYQNEQEAYEAGLKALGNTVFLIKRAVAEDEVVRFPALNVGVINANI
jgi:hypothetical protein